MAITLTITGKTCGSLVLYLMREGSNLSKPERPKLVFSSLRKGTSPKGAHLPLTR